MNKQQIRAMVTMNIIDNCTMELDNRGQERYSLDEQQFGKCIDTLVKNINVNQRYSIEDIERCVENWGMCKVEKEYIVRFLNG